MVPATVLVVVVVMGRGLAFGNYDFDEILSFLSLAQCELTSYS